MMLDVAHVGRIPLRNIWFLFLYAADLARFVGRFDGEVEDSSDLPDLVARLLCHAVEKRLRRSLSRGYRLRTEALTRVRGRIDILRTEQGRMRERGQIVCRYDDHTLNTPRNRLVRAALDALAGRVDKKDQVHLCRDLAGSLGRKGVSGLRPSRTELATDPISRHDAEDKLMVALAEFVFDLVLPTEDEGSNRMVSVSKDERLVRELFEKAVRNFLYIEFGKAGWSVGSRKLTWQVGAETQGIAAILPNMYADVILENRGLGRRIIMDTKFTSIFTRSQWRETSLKSGYLYQLYAYVRSQARTSDPLSHGTEGILLHPAINIDVDEAVVIQGHVLRFLTVDLAGTNATISDQLRQSIIPRFPGQKAAASLQS